MGRLSPAPRHHVGSVKLLEAERQELQRIILRLCSYKAASLLGFAPSTILDAASGAAMQPKTIERLRAALAQQREEP